MNTLANYRLSRELSTMEKLAADRERLLRNQYISRVVSLAVWIGVAWIAAWQLGVWIAEKGGGL